ncbi:hypothetical protein [Streptomyces sp. NPDC059894]|uniref:hypothetical protein n=1 Tax=unclassified Streptomyces TaxID=2593676 RepID=UPI00365317D6
MTAGVAIVGAAAYGGVSLATSANEDLARGFPPYPSASSPTAGPLTGTVTAEQKKRLGSRVAASTDNSVTAYAPSREGDIVTFPVILTNPSSAPRVVRAHIEVHASPGGQQVSLYEGAVDSGGPLAPRASLLTEISVQGAHSIPLSDLAVEVRSLGSQG